MMPQTLPTNWKTMTGEERLQFRLAAWSAPKAINFESPEAEKKYYARIKRFIDAMSLRVPDRVPLHPSIGGFLAGHYGYTEEQMMKDPEKAAEVALKGTVEFETDGKLMAGGAPSKVFELLDYKLFSWPGHGVDPTGAWQFNEAEYMTADEYDALLLDPSDYWMRVHMPRIAGTLAPFAKLAPAVEMIEQIHVIQYVSRFAAPDVQESVMKLLEAARETMAWQMKLMPVNKKLDEKGFPAFGGGFCYAPFDFLGDTLRGTRGIIADMYRKPAKLLEALEHFTPYMINMGKNAMMGGCPVVTIPLHKGADGFMSEEQFKKFYWPSLLAVIKGLNAEGLVVRLFAEGGYNSRLEILAKDLPKAGTIWYFDYTDMQRAKDTIGKIACIQGNVPVALIHTGTPDEIKKYCKDVIKVAGKNGGYIMSTGAGIGRGAKPENVHALLNATKEYGVYA